VVVDVLRQRSRSHPQAKRDELADSLIARAIRAPAPPNPAVAVLAEAGRASLQVDAGTADPRALDWLIRIHRESRDHETRRYVILQLTDQAVPMRAVPYLREVATRSEDRTSSTALRRLVVLARDTAVGTSAGERQQVMAQLREMWERRLVTNGIALVDLTRLAESERWSRPPG
jgi:hypothetical protein